MMKEINLRDIASKVQETLNLTDDQFGNLNVSQKKKKSFCAVYDTSESASRSRDIQRTSRGRRAMGKPSLGVARPLGSLERLHVQEDGEKVRKHLCREHGSSGNHPTWDGTTGASGSAVLDRCTKAKNV